MPCCSKSSCASYLSAVLTTMSVSGSSYPELVLAMAAGERPAPRLGEFREGVVMTRFFSHLCLTEGPEGALEPFAEEVPEPVATEPGEA